MSMEMQASSGPMSRLVRSPPLNVVADGQWRKKLAIDDSAPARPSSATYERRQTSTTHESARVRNSEIEKSRGGGGGRGGYGS